MNRAPAVSALTGSLERAARRENIAAQERGRPQRQRDRRQPAARDRRDRDLGLDGVLGEGFLVTAFFAMKPWAQAHADIVARFAAVIRNTADWANKNPDKSAEILAKYSKMDVANVRDTVRSRFATTLSPAQFQPTIDASAHYKLLDSSFPADQLIFTAK